VVEEKPYKKIPVPDRGVSLNEGLENRRKPDFERIQGFICGKPASIDQLNVSSYRK